MSGGGRRAGIVALTVAIAVVVNLAIFAIGALVGGDYRFTTAGSALRVDAVTLAGFTALPLALGLALAAVLSSRWRSVIPTALVVGPILALGSILVMTVPAGFDQPSFLALALCHAALVPAMVLGLRALAQTSPTVAPARVGATSEGAGPGSPRCAVQAGRPDRERSEHCAAADGSGSVVPGLCAATLCDAQDYCATSRCAHLSSGWRSTTVAAAAPPARDPVCWLRDDPVGVYAPAVQSCAPDYPRASEQR